MGLLDGQLAGVFSSIMGTFFLDASLFRAVISHDGEGGGSNSFAAPEAVKAQLDSTTTAQQGGDGFIDTDQRILVLASGIAPISTDDEIAVGGKRWAIASVTVDPVGSYYDLRGRLSANPEAVS